MRTAPRARSPDPRPETRRQSRRSVAAARGSPTPRAGREGDRKRPPSILRRSQPEHPGRGAEPPRTSKRVRFHEPVEVAVRYIAGREPTPATKGPLPAAGAVAWPAAGAAARPVLRLPQAPRAGPGGPAGPAPRPRPAPAARGPRLLALPAAAVTAPMPRVLWAGPRGPLRAWSSSG
ncbi:nutritionally-regulated adipose and cardiac-enriched [Phyllostomus discolor]|uniref:Nutritionally-regulated adipose and cardiac-enriched n=1 Tax=Phyllostomus discolor TaxID=89673 RepID=A0A834BA93_9CHIR|nr:nutritionally-regulated adipose and cardiac-enriched [Phyllostomus discolor]